MKQEFFTIISNEALVPATSESETVSGSMAASKNKSASGMRPVAAVYKMVLSGNTSAITAPGQFVNIKLDGFFLRRPISVCDVSSAETAEAPAGNSGMLTIIYKIVGNGTEAMSKMKAGRQLDILTGLGNGYNTTESGENPLLIGGGAGVPPLYLLAKILLKEGKKPTVLMGFNTAAEIFYKEEFEKLGVRVVLTTADGSCGIKGFVSDAMPNLEYSYIYACGPEPMLKAIDAAAPAGLGGQFSFEERMGCGFGACMGCSCKTKYGNRRICKDGPVLSREEIIW